MDCKNTHNSISDEQNKRESDFLENFQSASTDECVWQEKDNANKKDIPIVRVCLFGGLRAYVNGKLIDDSKWPRSKGKLFFAHLVTKFGREISRHSLIDTLWPDMDFKRAKDNLYVAWASIKKALENEDGETPYVINRDCLYRIDSRLVESDVEEFDRLARKLLFGCNTSEETESMFARMDQLYCGDLMAGIKCDPQMERIKSRYRETYVDVLVEAAQTMVESNNLTRALWFARKAYEIETRREDVYRALMYVQGAAGQRSAAIKTYFDCKEYLDDELGIPLSKRTIELYEKLLEDKI